MKGWGENKEKREKEARKKWKNRESLKGNRKKINEGIREKEWSREKENGRAQKGWGEIERRRGNTWG